MELNALRANIRVTAFGLGLVTALAVAWLSVAGSAQESTDTVPVCVGADRVLRFVEVEKDCKKGEQRFILASATVESESEEPGESKKPSDKPAEKPDRSAGQGSSSDAGRAMKVTAPFEVVDAQGNTIMKVGDDDGTYGRGIYVFNNQKRPVARVGVSATDAGGVILVRDKTAAQSCYMAMHYPASGPQFTIKGNDGKLLLVMNQQGSVWYNNNEQPAISLGAGESGSKGVFKIADESGTSVVEAGSLQGGRGIVRVFPSRGQTPLNIPQFLMGSKP